MLLVGAQQIYTVNAAIFIEKYKMSYAAILWFLCVFLNLIDLFDNDNKGGYICNQLSTRLTDNIRVNIIEANKDHIK